MTLDKDLEDAWTGGYHQKADNIADLDPNPTSYLRRRKQYIRKDETWADLGCGHGRNMQLIAAQGAHPVGIDISANALARTERFLEMRGVDDYTLLQSDIEHLEAIDPESLDGVVLTTVMTHIRNRDKSIKEILRVLKSGGYMIADFATTRDPTYSWISKSGVPIEADTGAFYYGTGQYVKYNDQPEEVAELLHGFEIKELAEIRFKEGGHPGTARPNPHYHQSYVVVARKL